MNINNWWLGLFVILVAALVIWLIKANRKDEKDFEKDMIQPDIKPEEHKANAPEDLEKP